MNNAMGHLLMTMASVDIRQRKQVSDFEMVICQNEAEAIKEVKFIVELPLERQKPAVSQLLGRQRANAPQLLQRWRCIVLLTL